MLCSSAFSAGVLVKESLFLVIWSGLEGFRLGVATTSPPAGGGPATRHSSSSERYSVQLSLICARITDDGEVAMYAVI